MSDIKKQEKLIAKEEKQDAKALKTAQKTVEKDQVSFIFSIHSLRVPSTHTRTIL